VQEESFPQETWFFLSKNAINYCLKNSGLEGKDLDFGIFYDNPFIKFKRILETNLSFDPFGIRSFIKAIPLWINAEIMDERI
jgi:carbamoyltransferase